MPSSTVSERSFTDLRKKAGGRRTFTAPVKWEPEAREASDGSLVLRGMAAVFNSDSHDLGGFVETLAPGCFTRALQAPGSDQFLLWSHDPDAILARRSAGTLDLTETATGLQIEARLVPTQLARDVHMLVKTGHVTGMSFAFSVGQDKWSGQGKSTRRRITDIGSLFEVTVCPSPAYPAASASARSRQVLANELSEMREQARKAINQTLEGKPRQMPTPTKTRSKPVVQVLTTRDPYSPESPYSWFRDKATVAHDEARHRQLVNPAGKAEVFSREARDRLNDHAEARTLNATNTSGGDFVPTGAIPQSIALGFGISARARAVVTGLLPTEALPAETGMTVNVPRFSTGASVSVQAAQNDAVSQTDPATALASSPVVTLTGMVEMSQQLFDRGAPASFDQAVAAELGSALAERLEIQILNGSGSSGQLTGLIPTSGIGTATYTSSSPTVSGVVSKLGELISTVHQAAGTTPSFIALHPRRAAWLQSQSDTTGQPIRTNVGIPLVSVPALPLDSSSRDIALAIVADGVRLFLAPPQIQIVTDFSGTSTLSVRVVATQYAALVLPRAGSSIGKLTGSGMAAPVFA